MCIADELLGACIQVVHKVGEKVDDGFALWKGRELGILQFGRKMFGTHSQLEPDVKERCKRKVTSLGTGLRTIRP